MRTRVCLAVALLPSLLVACVPFEPAVELAPPHTGPSAPADCPSGQLGWQCDAATGCTAVCSAPTGGTSSTAAPGREAAMPALPLGAHAREGAVASLQIESIEGAQRRTDVVRGPATVLRYPARQYLFTARTLRTASDGQRPGDLYVFVDRSSAAGSWVRYVETTRAGARVRYTGLGDVRLYVGAAPGELRLGLALSLVPAGANPLAASELRVRGVILGAHGRAGLGETTLGGWCGGVWDLFPAPLTEEALLGPDLDCWDDAGQPVPLCFDTPADEVDVTYDTQQVEPDDGAAPDDGAGVVVPPPPPPIEDDGVGGANVAPPVSDTGDGALLGDDEDDSGVPAGASSTGGSSDTGGSGGDSGGSDSGGSWGGDSGGSDSGGSWGGDSGGGDSGGDW